MLQAEVMLRSWSSPKLRQDAVDPRQGFWQIAVQRWRALERSGVILFRVHAAVPENITPLPLRTMAGEQE